MKNLVDLNSKHILILGASTEIGIKTAETLCKLGAKVDIADIDINSLEKRISYLCEDDNHCFEIDLSSSDSIREKIIDAVKAFGKYDGLVYSGDNFRSTPLNNTDMETLKEVYNTNCFGFIESVKAISQKDMYYEGMRIVGVSSIAAFKGMESYSGYAGSKASIEGTVKSLAIELASKHICINTVSIGYIDDEKFDDYKQMIGENSIRYRVLLERQASGIGTPQDIANVIAFLLSGASRFITGQNIVADGGYSA